jgi:pimeloyl-ACP methyl ester carboxylesterase
VGRVTSKDGTSIAYDRQGSGPAVILVTGGLDDGSENAPLATELAAHFTAYNYNRRGRGESDDSPQYTLEREVEDLEALMAETGEPAHLYGVSSGGALALEAAAAGLPIDTIAVYEVPYQVGEDALRRWRAYVEQLGTLLTEDCRGDAVELFMRLAGASERNIKRAKNSPFWPGLVAIAHTLAYDAACLGDGEPPAARLAEIKQPTLVATGGEGVFDQAADAIAAGIPSAERLTLEGQGHVVDPVVLAPVLRRFFGE